MRSLLAIGVVTLALAVVFALGAAVGADAKPKKTRTASRVTVEAVGPNGVSGHVSGNRACRAQRQVAVYRVNSGPSVPSGEFFATTWTRADGTWSVPGPVYPSEFYAVVSKKSAKRVVCGSDTSNSLAWG